MATFSVGFLGCKVSHVDAHAVRERLLADGHSERAGGADVAVVSTCCVTHEAVSKSRKAVSRLARTHGRVYVTGCAANLPANAFAGLADNVVVVAQAERGHARGRRRRRRRDRVRPGGSSPRSRPRLRQGAGRVQLLVRVLRDPAGAGSVAEPPSRRCAARDRAPRSRGSSRGRAHRHQPRLLPGSRRRLRPAAARARGRLHARSGAAAPLVDRGEPRERGARRSAARDAHGGPASPHPAAVGRRSDPRGDGAGATTRRPSCAEPASRTASISRPTSSSAFPARTSRPSATR